MTMLIFMTGILISCAYEAVVDYYGFSLEKKIREMQNY